MTILVMIVEKTINVESIHAKKLVNMEFVFPFDPTMENVTRIIDLIFSFKEDCMRKYGVMIFSVLVDESLIYIMVQKLKNPLLDGGVIKLHGLMCCVIKIIF